MITYILKTILCSSVLILLYYLFLEREKMYRFNRFYLLFSIAFSFIVPLITIRISSSINQISETINPANSSFSNTVLQQTQSPVIDNNPLPSFLLLFYIIITTFLICRYFRNIFVILSKIKNNSSVRYYEARLVLTQDKRVPYSFLKFVFLYREDYERGAIEKEIMGHELTHVKQNHSFDILFFELLISFVWFNPLLLLYRKAIQLNHEFLADEFVIKTLSDTQTYQLLLLDKAQQTGSLVFSSSFNYLLTKKRIAMMNKDESKKVAIFKQIALIPVIAAIGFLFMTKVIAQDKITLLDQQQIESTQSGVSQGLLKEYQDIINMYKKTLENGKESYSLNITPEDKERLEKIFLQMSKEQQANQLFIFVPANSMVLPGIVPSKEQLESFKDPKIYGIWINKQRVSNSVLSNYKNTDFANVMVSKLEKNATNYGKHDYQVNLMTNDDYRKYYDETIAKKGYILVANFMNKHETKREVDEVISAVPITNGIRMPRKDKTGKEWWQLVAYDRGFNYDSYTKYGKIVILGKKSTNNEEESFINLVALAGGKDNNGKGNDVIVIIHSETASYSTRSKELIFNNCRVEEWPLDSFHQEPLKSYTLKILGIDISNEFLKLAVR